MSLKYEMAAVKGCWMFSIWVMVDGQKVPVYNIISAKEGPEAWIAVDDEKEYTVHYSIRRVPEKRDQCFLEDFPDFEVSCVADGDLMDVNLTRLNEVLNGTAGGDFEGRQLPKKKMRRMIFARPQLTKKQTKANLDRMGTIEVAFQRCDASHGEAFVNKETLPIKTLNEKGAAENHIDMVTSFGPVVPSSKVPTNITGTIAPTDSDDFVSMQLRYVTKETLKALGYMQEEEPVAPSPPIQHSQPKSKRAAAPSSARAKERPVATPKKVVAPVREMSEELQPHVTAEAPQVVQEVLGTIAAIATIQKTLTDKLSKLQNATAAQIAVGYVDVSNISAAIGCMKPSFQTQLRAVEGAVSSKASMARYGPATEQVQEMAEGIFTMNKMLQDKAKELQVGPTSGNATGLKELASMSKTLRIMIGSMREALESVEDQEQDSSRRRWPESVQDDTARRSTAKRRKIV